MLIDERVKQECKNNPKIRLFDFPWPEKEELKIFIKDILEPEPVDSKYYLSEKQVTKLLDALSKKDNNFQSRRFQSECSSTLAARDYKDPKIVKIEWDLNKDGLSSQQNMPYSVDTHSPTLGTNGSPKIFQFNRHWLRTGKYGDGTSEKVSFTLDSGSGNDLLMVQVPHGTNPGHLKETEVCPSISKSSWENNNFISQLGVFRRLTPKECFRLQGFLNDEVNLIGISNSQAYKMAGNGQSVNVVEKIFRQMFLTE
jgi:site-specific DNA-cytosine methylase